MGGEMQELVLITGFWMNSLYGKLSMRQRSCLVEDNSIDFGKYIHVVGTLDKNTFTRGTTDTSKEGKRYADDQGTGTTDD